MKIRGKVNMQLCDAKGCVQPKDYPFTAALRPEVRAIAAAPATPANEDEPCCRRILPPVSAPPTAEVRQPPG